jgi:hypothetical protein
VLEGRLNLLQVNKDKAQQVKTELIHQEVVKFEVKSKIEGLSKDVGD